MSTTAAELQDIVEEDIVPVTETKSPSSSTTSMWKEENYDFPKSEFSLDFVTLPSIHASLPLVDLSVILSFLN